MMIVRIKEGLGNQMFQYMLFCALKERYPEEDVKIDISDYTYSYAHTGYSLEKYFNIAPEKADTREINQVRYIPAELYFKNKKAKGLKKMILGIRYKQEKKNRKHLKRWNIEGGIHNLYHPEVFDLLPGNWYFDGYWQNPAYFKELKQNIPAYFPFKRTLNEADQALSQTLSVSESVFVHVRRGDYVGKIYDLCGEEYYRKAKEVIEQHVENPLYVFFSDDPEYVRQHFAWGENQLIVAHSAEDCDFDMQLMTQCRHAIMANSSFSFWAAMLRKRSGVVVCPMYLKVEHQKRFRMEKREDWIYLDNIQEG